jgi:hypothetical protein
LLSLVDGLLKGGLVSIFGITAGELLPAQPVRVLAACCGVSIRYL